MPAPPQNRGTEFVNLLAKVLQKAGWHFKVTGDEIYKRLASNGFKAEFLGHHKPPAAHYRLIDPGLEFYAEFVAPFAGSAVTQRGRSKATQSVGGISSQNLRYVEVLLVRPWSVTLSASNGFPLADDTRVQIANPVSFLVQKIFIFEEAQYRGIVSADRSLGSLSQ